MATAETEGLRAALVAATIPDHAIDPAASWTGGLWIADTCAIGVVAGRPGRDDGYGNLVIYESAEQLAAAVAAQYWTGDPMPGEPALAALPTVHQIAAWHPGDAIEDRHSHAWRRALQLDDEPPWHGPNLTSEDVWAPIAGRWYQHLMPDDTDPVAVRVCAPPGDEHGTEGVHLEVTAIVPDELGGYPTARLQPSKSHTVPMGTLLDLAETATGRDHMHRLLVEHIEQQIVHVHDAAFAALRARWAARE